VAFTTVPDKASGDVFTEQMWDIYLRDNMNNGMIRPLGDTILLGATNIITFSVIPQDQAALAVVLYARNDSAVTARGAYIRFNSDSAGNYDWQILVGQGPGGSFGLVTAGESFAASQMAVGQIPAANAPANTFGPTIVFIPAYALVGPHKLAYGLSYEKHGTTANTTTMRGAGGHWRSGNAITSVSLIQLAGEGNFATGSRATLYGIGGT
jgi:hypothetical protein